MSTVSPPSCYRQAKCLQAAASAANPGLAHLGIKPLPFPCSPGKPSPAQLEPWRVWFRVDTKQEFLD